ncbi:mechanosensitive ion channel family protein [Pedobacter gandavensis]|uniref:mechanosensitive ion channel family protein n=1 Tax=Pedobacter gandavensis TaxID=2679963 RepID=UPI00292F4C06|nr:mechanosensitive ion channel domain-containing protein [Pedobacter gandavensis]
MSKIEFTLDQLLMNLIGRLPSFLMAIVTLLVGLWLIKFLIRFLTNRFTKGKIDISLSAFLLSVIKAVLYILLLLTVASTLGIQTTSFVAVLGAAGLAVGLALQGSLSNFAGGVLILLFKPFKVGHSISSNNGVSGTVLKIDILYTTLQAGNGTTLYAPNGPLANAVINNLTDNETRMMEYVIGVSYDSDVNVAREAILKALAADSQILKDPAPKVLVTALADSSISLTIRAWAKNTEFWPVYHRNFQLIKEELDKNSIGIPAPQREVHVITATETAK